ATWCLNPRGGSPQASPNYSILSNHLLSNSQSLSRYRNFNTCALQHLRTSTLQHFNTFKIYLHPWRNDTTPTPFFSTVPRGRLNSLPNAALRKWDLTLRSISGSC